MNELSDQVPLDFLAVGSSVRWLDLFTGPTTDQLLVDLFLDLFLTFHGVIEINSLDVLNIVWRINGHAKILIRDIGL